MIQFSLNGYSLLFIFICLATLPPLINPCTYTNSNHFHQIYIDVVSSASLGTNNVYWNITSTRYAGTSSSGSNLNQLSSPTGLSIDSNDTLYITDSGNYRVMKYVRGATSGTIVAGNGTGGNELSQLAASGSRYNFVDSNRNVYVSDTYNGRVVRWANGATSGVIVAGNGSYGTTLNQLAYPYGVWVDSSLNVFIAEYQIHRVTMWSPGAITGVLIAGGNAAGKENRSEQRQCF